MTARPRKLPNADAHTAAAVFPPTARVSRTAEDTGGGIVGIVGSGGRHERHGRGGASPRRALAGYKSAIRWLMIAYKACPDREILRQMTQYLRRAEYLEETLAAAHSEIFKDSENSEHSDKSGTSDGLGTPGDPAASASGSSTAGTAGTAGTGGGLEAKTVDDCQTDLAAKTAEVNAKVGAEIDAEIDTDVDVGTLDRASSDGVGSLLAVAVEGARGNMPNSSNIYASGTDRADNSATPGAPQLVTATCSSLTIQWTAPTSVAPARGGGGGGVGGDGGSAITVLYEVSWRRIWGSDEGSDASGSDSIASEKRAGGDTGNSGATGNVGDDASPHHVGRWHLVPHPIVGSDSEWRHPMYTLNLLRQAAAEQYQVSTYNVCRL